MILQALNDYYARAQLAPPGWELKAIPFFIVLDHAGQVVSVTSRADKENRRGSSILVPQSEIRSGKNAWAQPNFLWDHYGFVLGEPKRKPNGEIDPSDSVEKAAKQLGAFIARVESMALKYPKSIGLAAMSKFYRQGEYKKVFSRPDAAEMAKIAGANMTFRLADAVEPVIHESWLQNHISLGIGFEEDGDTSSAVQMGVCLVTGKVEEIARLHPKVYGVCSKPSPLAAANSKEAPAYSSYGKEQGFIFPVGKPAAFSYATALNHLLRRDSTQRIQIGDASTVFWSEKESEFESAIPDILVIHPKTIQTGVSVPSKLCFSQCRPASSAVWMTTIAFMCWAWPPTPPASAFAFITACRWLNWASAFASISMTSKWCAARMTRSTRV